jgi:hypothetical protein
VIFERNLTIDDGKNGVEGWLMEAGPQRYVDTQQPQVAYSENPIPPGSNGLSSCLQRWPDLTVHPSGISAIASR